MSLEQMVDRIVETEVLVIGGGIGGCCTAAKAAENGLNVTLLEKGNTVRSGNAGQGIDHYGMFPRDGFTPLELVKGFEASQNLINGEGRWGNPNVVYNYFKHGFWAVDELEKLGVPMRWDDGELYWFPRADADGKRYWLRVHWQNVKPILSQAVRTRGVNVLERTMGVDLLTKGDTVVGATAVNVRTGEFVVIKAKAVVMATGMFQRCYNGEAPMSWYYKLRYDGCPASLSGDGYAMAYRAGAELCNMDANGWMFRVRDDLMISFGNFEHGDGMPSKYFSWTGEEFTFIDARKYEELEREGRTPLYRGLDHLPDDWQRRMEIAYVDEKMVDFKFAEERGFNPRTHRFELTPFKPLTFMAVTGIYIDEDYRTRLKGFYAIGDCASPLHDCSNAAVSGFLTANSLPAAVRATEEPVVDEAQVARQKQIALAPLRVKDGTEPMELECSVRYICERYVSLLKSEGKLKEGLRRLRSLRRVFLPKIQAKNPHELMRYLEARNVLDLAEVHLTACLERKETRGNFIRLDYPQRDPERDDKLTFQRTDEGKPMLEIRETPKLKPEYTLGGK